MTTKTFTVSAERSLSKITFVLSSEENSLVERHDVCLDGEKSRYFYTKVLMSMGECVENFSDAIGVSPHRVWREIGAIIRNNHEDGFQRLPVMCDA